MISKKRYWGLALPIWECDTCHHYEVIGDEVELRDRAVEGWDTFAGHTPHRPYVDAVKIACPQCGGVMSRVPDVGNPWLDAGIVPFSTLQYRRNRAYWETWYPADWISESFPGQFRNWFYSLLAMATVIDGSPPFRENFSYATLLAEDGRPMHKSAGNSIEFNEAADRMGVDVMRWLYCSQKPENNLLFGYNRADEKRRQFLLPLWNAYNFFVSYAILDGWEPDREGFVPGNPEGAPPDSTNVLDRWIVARLNQVVAESTTFLENSDAYSVTLAVEALLDDLTNWYVRRSRRRFWKSEQDADKNAAYATLYYVLVRLTKLLAPMTPFVTEAMYQNLVRSVRAEAYESVHHCDWPVPAMEMVDQDLLAQMDLARRLASLGLGARGSANIKVRQPLNRALAYVADELHQGAGRGELSLELADIVRDELNVKELVFAEDEARLVTYRVVADGRQLGPRFGRRFPKVRAALAAATATAADAAAVVRRVRAGAPVTLEVDGETVELAPEEIIVHTQPAEGLAVANDRGVTVAVDTVITPALQAEGLVRDLVRQVQTLRKEADYRLDQRISVGLFGLSEDTRAAMAPFQGYFCDETLCTNLLFEDDGRAWDRRQTVKVDGQSIEVAVRR
jgi:isoleucyl-tRNA synthetase